MNAVEHALQDMVRQLLLQVVGHENQDKILLGRGSARVGSRHGDNHFWVIRRHEFSGAICFLI
jgi:hypothetical protein